MKHWGDPPGGHIALQKTKESSGVSIEVCCTNHWVVREGLHVDSENVVGQKCGHPTVTARLDIIGIYKGPEWSITEQRQQVVHEDTTQYSWIKPKIHIGYIQQIVEFALRFFQITKGGVCKQKSPKIQNDLPITKGDQLDISVTYERAKKKSVLWMLRKKAYRDSVANCGNNPVAKCLVSGQALHPTAT